MATGIPTFRLEVTEGMIDVDTSADRLFGYCIEATKGPIMEPTFVASSAEAKRIFGKSFAPHFYQKPTGLVITRVGFDGMTKPSLTYQAFPMKKETVDGQQVTSVNTNGTPFDVIKIEGVTEGTVSYTIDISRSWASTTSYNLSIIIDDITSKTYQGLADLKSIERVINSKFSNYITATILATDEQLENFNRDQLITREREEDFNMTVSDKLTGGSNGYLKKTDGTQSNVPINTDGTVPASSGEGNAQTTLMIAYRKAFNKMKDVDLLGIATLSDQKIVQNELVLHINEVTDPEVAQLRFGITGYLDYKENTEAATPVLIDTSAIYEAAEKINNEYIIYIGQGVIFEEDGVQRKLYPHECVQLYTGIRSALGYSEAIFGGEQKKVLIGVKDVLPVVTNIDPITKEMIVDLNKHGVCTFKKEYGEVTFVEGVTTTQENDVLSYESIMSIVVYVTKRLIRVAKPYQGQNLNEDLKSTLTTALSNELNSIVQTDGTLVALEDYNIPPYDVSVKSAAVTAFNEAGELVRESKIIIQCKIVPIGALRDIDLGVIVI